MKKRTGKVQLHIINNCVFNECIYNKNGTIKTIPNSNRNLSIDNCIITDNNGCMFIDDYGRITVQDCNIIIVPINHRSDRETPIFADYYDDTADDSDSGFENTFAMSRTTAAGYEM